MIDTIAGAVNLRDIGGLPAGDRTVRHGLIYRSGQTHHITADGLAQLAESAGVRTVIDLRNDRERDGATAAFADHGIRHVSLPMVMPNNVTPGSPQMRDMLRQMADSGYDWPALYRTMIDNNHATFRAIFDELAAPNALPAIVQCAGGRDRTGVTIALLLGMLGVTDDRIAGDYARSGDLLADSSVARDLRIAQDLGLTDDQVATLTATPPESMIGLLDDIRERDGGIEPLLRAMGVPDTTIETLREALLIEG